MFGIVKSLYYLSPIAWVIHPEQFEMAWYLILNVEKKQLEEFVKPEV